MIRFKKSKPRLTLQTSDRPPTPTPLDFENARDKETVKTEATNERL